MSVERLPPLVTVAILTYEQGHILDKSIFSVCQQSYENIELLVCDDGSLGFNEKKVIQLIDKYRGENITSFSVYHHKTNRGTVQNCNWALSYAQGLYIKFLAADDMLYDKEVIKDLVGYFKEEDIKVVCGRGFSKVNGKGFILPTDMEYARLLRAYPKQLYYLLCSRPWSCILAPAVLFRTASLRQWGGFDSSYQYLEDWPLWIKLSRRGVSLKIIPRVIVQYGISGISTTREKSERAYLVRKKYLEECREVLKRERQDLTGRPILKLQCFLSERCLARRERKLDQQNKGFDIVPASCWDGFSLIYQKLVGGIGNQHFFPYSFIVILTFLGIGCLFHKRKLLSIIFFAICFFVCFWNGLLQCLRRKFGVNHINEQV